MGIIPFLLRLHASNLRRRLAEHKKNNPTMSAEEIAKMNQEHIDRNRRRLESAMQSTNKPFSLFGE